MEVGADYVADCDGKPFAVLRIVDRAAKAWDTIAAVDFAACGFSSTELMKRYLLDNNQILSSFRDVVWLHSFVLQYEVK